MKRAAGGDKTKKKKPKKTNTMKTYTRNDLKETQYQMMDTRGLMGCCRTKITEIQHSMSTEQDPAMLQLRGELLMVQCQLLKTQSQLLECQSELLHTQSEFVLNAALESGVSEVLDESDDVYYGD